MLKIKDLIVEVDNKVILDSVNLEIQEGEIHALMGPNGSGKSTLAYSLLGHPKCNISHGSVQFFDQDITSCAVQERAKLGLFLALQYPQEIPGLDIFSFLKEIYCVTYKKNILNSEFYEYILPLLKSLKLDESYLERGLNEGFSGGEKKRLEILQLLVLKPKVAILDEIDSGLDVDALKIVADALLEYKCKNPTFSIIIVTHYQKILNYIYPDAVHIFRTGKIVHSGGAEVAKLIEARGYNEFSV